MAIFNLLDAAQSVFSSRMQLTNMGYGVCLPGDIRYRFERMVSYLGGRIYCPWYW
jgi:hypothetical protein